MPVLPSLIAAALFWTGTAEPGAALSGEPLIAEAKEAASRPGSGEGWIALDAWRDAETAQQVRIERRVVIRIAPVRTGARAARTGFVEEARPAAVQPRLIERPFEGCVELESIAGSRVGRGNRLMLFLNDRRVLTARMPRNCRARDFYSGFYVERHADGRLCASRDLLRSRVGTACATEQLSRLEQVSPP